MISSATTETAQSPDSSNQQIKTPIKSEQPSNEKASNLTNQGNKEQQTHKDRTLFCINIHEDCTEDILYELFLQVLLNVTKFITFHFFFCLNKPFKNIHI